MEAKVTDLQRIARIFNLKADDPILVLKIGDIIKAKDSEIKKKTFSNNILWAKNKQQEVDIHNLKNEFAESVGIHEHMMVKNSRDTIQKQLNKALEENHKRNETVRKFNDKLKQIEENRGSEINEIII